MSMNEVARRAGRDQQTTRRRLMRIDMVTGGKLLSQTGAGKRNPIMVATEVLLREWPDVFRVTFASDSEVDEIREEIGELRHAVRAIASAVGVRLSRG